MLVSIFLSATLLCSHSSDVSQQAVHSTSLVKTEMLEGLAKILYRHSWSNAVVFKVDRGPSARVQELYKFSLDPFLLAAVVEECLRAMTLAVL